MKRWVVMLCAAALVLTALPMLTFGTASAAITEVDGVRWFPVPAEKQNDEAWEAECIWDGCYCQGFTETPATTGLANYLDTDWGENGELTVTRNGNDGKGGVYWPRFRTVNVETAPMMNLQTANTLYFNFDVAEGTTWNLMLSFNGFYVKLSKVISDAAGKVGEVTDSEQDGGSGHFEGTVNLQDALRELAAENGTESSWFAEAILSMPTVAVPQMSMFCVGEVGASLTVNELFLSTADDTDGVNTRLVDMGLLTGMGDAYYAEPIITEVEAVRWFPVPAAKQNDDAWEAEYVKSGSLCQGFTEVGNFLDTAWGAGGELTVTRNGNDGTNGIYWPRFRTVAIETSPKLDIQKANTLYFDFDVAEGTTWNLMLSFNGFHVKLSKVIADAAGKRGTVAHSDVDGGSGHFEGTVNLQDALRELAAENGTESSFNAAAILSMSTTFVPQLSVLCVGEVGASLTVNELFLSTEADVNGTKARLVDMGLLTGLGYQYYGLMLGDLSGDGNLNTMDALLLYGGVNGRRTLTAAQQELADISGDGKINMMDALLLYKTASGK